MLCCKAVLGGGPPPRGGAKAQKAQQVRQTAGLHDGRVVHRQGHQAPESSGWQGPAWRGTSLPSLVGGPGLHCEETDMRRREQVEGAHLRGSTVRTTV